MHTTAFAVVLEPLAQPRPLAQQCLVRDLGGRVAGDHEAVLDEGRQDRRVLVVHQELVEGCAAPHVVCAHTGLGEPEEDPARDVLL